LAFVLAALGAADVARAEEAPRRQIEEVVVTAERKESTVQDTSISITAFTGEMIEDFGLRNQEDLQNYIPATVIEPYDMSIRGIGRNFRALGGDPGVATYLNDVYSEDFGIASTEGGLFDIARIEVLRGPQGTLYGRNAIGGAINFVNNKPTDEFEAEARTIVGSYDLVEYYGLVSGPMIEDLLSYRIVGSKRTRDGYHEDISGNSGNEEVNNYGDENYSLALRLTPTDSIEINMRGNERSYARNVGNQGGSIVFDEFGGVADEVTGGLRNTSSYARGFRRVNPAQTDPLANDFVDPTQIGPGGVAGALFTFTNPTTGETVQAQRVRPGLDPAIFAGPNLLFGASANGQAKDWTVVSDPEDMDNDDLETATSGFNDEFFDHQSVSTDVRWDINDKLAVKYIFGYTDYFYDRTTDEELSANLVHDEQFYVSQETEYVSHELQFFFDPTDNITVTSGLFAYDAKITQRGDFYSSVFDPLFNQGASYGALGPTMAFVYGTTGRLPNADGNPWASNTYFQGTPATLFTAREVARANGIVDQTNGQATRNFETVAVFGPWAGDPGGTRVPHGPNTAGTSTEYQSRSEREAYAVYSQGEWQINDEFALTLGARWARDRLDGEENAFIYDETLAFPLSNDPASSPLGISLATYNFLATLDPNEPIRLSGIPSSASLFRKLDRSDEKITWRVNLDWTPSDSALLYASVTTGHRAGGYNLANFSSVDTYDPEELIAYEIGYKGQLMEGLLQVDLSAYYYDYETIHMEADVPSELSANGTSVSTVAVPEAEIFGVEGDALWLATDRITLGGNFSYTPSEYTSDFVVINNYDPRSPQSLFVAADRMENIKGNQLSRVPEWKWGTFGQYLLPLGDMGDVEFLLSYTWIDDVYFSSFESDEDKAPAYGRWDTRATWTSSEEDWVVAVFVNNVLDEIGIRQIDRTTEGSNWLRKGSTTDPRLYGLEVRYKFMP
jgi:outer membrane receptor protein involved in Fe transport